MTNSEEFAAFWAVYPRRVARFAAERAFTKARKQASFSEIIEGVRRYIKGKPAYADWAHASTWLNQGRWTDEYDVPRPFAVDWWAECKQLHSGQCAKRWDHEMKKREGAA